MQAFVTQADHTARLTEIPVPDIDDEEVLVKVTALAQNPTDWKRTSQIASLLLSSSESMQPTL